MTKLSNQERLYDETQLAKAIFVQRAAKLNFSTDRELNIPTIIDQCFLDAEAFLKHQEKRANEVFRGL